MIALQWMRTVTGDTASRCERFLIEPKYWGRVRPSSYELKLDGMRQCTCDTLAEAKLHAAALAKDLPSVDYSTILPRYKGYKFKAHRHSDGSWQSFVFLRHPYLTGSSAASGARTKRLAIDLAKDRISDFVSNMFK